MIFGDNQHIIMCDTSNPSMEVPGSVATPETHDSTRRPDCDEEPTWTARQCQLCGLLSDDVTVRDSDATCLSCYDCHNRQRTAEAKADSPADATNEGDDMARYHQSDSEEEIDVIGISSPGTSMDEETSSLDTAEEIDIPGGSGPDTSSSWDGDSSATTESDDSLDFDTSGYDSPLETEKSEAEASNNNSSQNDDASQDDPSSSNEPDEGDIIIKHLQMMYQESRRKRARAGWGHEMNDDSVSKRRRALADSQNNALPGDDDYRDETGSLDNDPACDEFGRSVVPDTGLAVCDKQSERGGSQHRLSDGGVKIASEEYDADSNRGRSYFRPNDDDSSADGDVSSSESEAEDTRMYYKNRMDCFVYKAASFSMWRRHSSRRRWVQFFDH